LYKKPEISLSKSRAKPFFRQISQEAIFMNLKNLSNMNLHFHLHDLAKTERKITAQILELLIEIEKRKVYLARGYESLFSYLVKEMKYSEGAASRRIQAMRLLKNNSAVKIKIQDGELNLTQASMIQTAIRAEKKLQPTAQIAVEQILNQIIGKTKDQTKEILQNHFSEEALSSLEPQLLLKKTENQIKVELQFSHEEHDLLQKALHLRASQQTNFKELIIWMAQETLKKSKFASPKAQIASSILSPPNSPNPCSALAPVKQVVDSGDQASNPAVGLRRANIRSHIPIQIQRTVFKKSQHRCEHVSPITRQRCIQTKFLELDHRQPVAKGGRDTLDNLRVLCREHNADAARQMGLARPQVDLFN